MSNIDEIISASEREKRISRRRRWSSLLTTPLKRKWFHIGFVAGWVSCKNWTYNKRRTS